MPIPVRFLHGFIRQRHGSHYGTTLYTIRGDQTINRSSLSLSRPSPSLGRTLTFSPSLLYPPPETWRQSRHSAHTSYNVRAAEADASLYQDGNKKAGYKNGENDGPATKSRGSVSGSFSQKGVRKHWPRPVNYVSTPSPEREFDRIKSLGKVYSEMRRAAERGQTDNVTAHLNELLRVRGEQPNLALYAGLILANINPETGSAARVEQLLNELRKEGLTPDAETYHNALKALAVHPDCLLRDEILKDMENRWLELSLSGWHDVIAGCVREGQMELALEHMDSMRQFRVRPQGWLLDMILFRLCDLEEIDEAFRFLQSRVSADELSISPGIWYYLFDATCSMLRHEALSYIWQRRVNPKYLNPTTGQTMAVLTSASRHGDVTLATDVFRVLSERGFVFTTIHYELLLLAYLQLPDLKTALTITCIMAGAKLSLSPSALAPILSHLKQSPELPMQALDICKEMLRTEDRRIPTPVITSMIDAAVHHGSLNDAITIYKTLHTLSSTGPDANVFNALFRGCKAAAETAYLSEGNAPLSSATATQTSTMPSASAPTSDSTSNTSNVASPGASDTSSSPAINSLASSTTDSSASDTNTIDSASQPNSISTTTSPPQTQPPKQTAMFLASEMLFLKIPPNSLTYDRLLLCCLYQRDCRDAFRYYVEMREMGFWPRMGTWEAMVRRLVVEVGRVRRGEGQSRGGVRGDEGGGDEEERGKGREMIWQRQLGARWGGIKGGMEGTEKGTAESDGSNGVDSEGVIKEGIEGKVDSGHGGQGGSGQGEDVVIDRPLERAWALLQVMKNNRLPTARVERVLMET